MATTNGQAHDGVLDRLERVFEESAPTVPRQARDEARRRAVALLEATGVEPPADLALLGFATDMLVARAVDLASCLPELRRLIEEIESVAGISAVALGREVLRAPELLKLPTAVGIEVQLTLLLAFSNVNGVSLWTLWSGGGLTNVAHAGEFDVDAPQTRLMAHALLGGDQGHSVSEHEIAGIVVERLELPAAALIARGEAAGDAEGALLLAAAVPMLTATLERDELVGRRASLERAAGTSTELAEDLRALRAQATSERRLTRLRFDLHDGPQQDVLMLAEDLRLFRGQLATAIGGVPHRERLLGRIDDLEARLVALDGDLRRISSMHSPLLQSESLADAVAQLTSAFAARTAIEPQMRLLGDLTRLTDSQQISLLALIREALSNIREHSDARRVSIMLSADVSGIEATVTDDGRGFDPEAALVDAARAGRLGLVGMYERIRMLGGTTLIDSRPGGPTVISVKLPPGPAPSVIP